MIGALVAWVWLESGRLSYFLIFPLLAGVASSAVTAILGAALNQREGTGAGVRCGGVLLGDARTRAPRRRDGVRRDRLNQSVGSQ